MEIHTGVLCLIPKVQESRFGIFAKLYGGHYSPGKITLFPISPASC